MFGVFGPPETLYIQLKGLILTPIALWFLFASGRTCWTCMNSILGWKSARPNPGSLFTGSEWQPILNALYLLVILVLSCLSENPQYLTLFRLTVLKWLPWASWIGAAKIAWGGDYYSKYPELDYCLYKTKRQKLLLKWRRASAPVMICQWKWPHQDAVSKQRISRLHPCMGYKSHHFQTHCFSEQWPSRTVCANSVAHAHESTSWPSRSLSGSFGLP